ncbi:RDD family protein [Methylobacterium oryzae CBMB20]
MGLAARTHLHVRSLACRTRHHAEPSTRIRAALRSAWLRHLAADPARAGEFPGGRTVAYLLDILFIFGFTALLTLLITVIGVVTFGLGWTLFAVLPASGIISQRHHRRRGSKQSTIGQRMMGLRTVAPESGARVDVITAAVHALLFYVAISTFLPPVRRHRVSG